MLDRINLTSLRLLLAVHEEGTLTKAAAREAIAPSAISKRLADLELALGVTLFERSAKGMVLTPSGETLLHHARRMLVSAEQIAVEMAEHARGARGFIRMLSNLSGIVQFLPEDLQAFLVDHPSVKIDLEERPSTGVVEGVAAGLAEIGICSDDVETGRLQRLPYRADRLVVVMRPDNPLAGRASVAFRDTLAQDHIGLHLASSIYTRSLIEARLAAMPLKLRIHVPGFDAVCRMAQAGMGIGIVPGRAFALLGEPMGLTAVPLADDWGARTLQIVIGQAPLAPPAALLLAHLRRQEAEPS
jgi:DNA-binding transcriptional LysR family regulator